VTIEKLREVLHARPFESFTIHVADGRDVPVPHPDFISLDPRGRIVHVFLGDGRSEFIDFMLVTRIEIGDGKPRRSRRKRHRPE
jgi:hypothetical protein